ncbi:MAG: flagella basal body P-ring formation protein FlgA [Acidobacteriia bacterium]|nr:flagella basal body P-ring formation protein FlgA [Terriglobia bacterium]
MLAPQQIVHHLTEAPAGLRQFVIPDRITVRRAGHLIRREAAGEVISKFLRERGRSDGLPITAWQWPGTMESLEKDPSLEVEESRWDGQRHRQQFVLRCVTRPACSPFVVYAPEPEPSAVDSPLRDASQATHIPRLEAVGESGVSPVLTRAGQRATMRIEDGDIRISIEVICLQRGRLGQQIRVLDPARRRVFRATVLASNLLRMSS